jgi:hypothetical protein
MSFILVTFISVEGDTMDAKRCVCPGPDTMIHFWGWGLGFASGPKCAQHLCRLVGAISFHWKGHNKKEKGFDITAVD